MAKDKKKSVKKADKDSKPGNKADRTYPEQGSEKSVKKEKTGKGGC